MDRAMFDSPGKNTFLHESINCARSPTTYSTPVRQNDKKRRQNGLASGIAAFNVLPAHVTPPSGLTKFIARNPFDADLTSRLHLSVISPTVFTKVSPSVRHDSPVFAWSVDELALIQPAKIEEFPVQQMHSTDPDIEVVAQAAIDEFFTAAQIIPSPWDKDKNDADEESEMRTPSRPLDELNLTRETHKSKRDCWSQTVLTLPPVLPANVEEALKPFFTFSQDQNVDNEDANSSNSSLRRKLFFNHDDCSDDEDETSFCPSPTHTHVSMIQSSPPQSGMLAHGTPLKGRSFAQRTHGTPYAGNVSPPNMSPICNRRSSPESIRSRYQFAAHLDFATDMSVDQSARDDRESRSFEDDELDTNDSMVRSNIDDPEVREAAARLFSHEDVPDQDETAEMLSREATPLKREGTSRSATTSIGRDIPRGIKIANEWRKTNTDGCLQRDITLLGYSCTGQQSDVNSAQDTGYQTCSMSNVTGNTDNCSATNAKSFHWSEKILSNGDEIILSDWKDNMKNVFSSTPSKYARRRDN